MLFLPFFELLPENVLTLFQAQQVCPQYAVPYFFFLFFGGFFERFIHAKNSSKKFTIGNFFSLSSNFISLFSSSISFSIKLSTAPVLFVIKLYGKRFASLLLPLFLEVYVYSSQGFFYFVQIFDFVKINYTNCLI